MKNNKPLELVNQLKNKKLNIRSIPYVLQNTKKRRKAYRWEKKKKD